MNEDYNPERERIKKNNAKLLEAVKMVGEEMNGSTEQITIVGQIAGLEPATIEKHPHKIKINVGWKSPVTVTTFDKNSLAAASQLLNAMVQLSFTEKPNPKYPQFPYRNLVDNSLVQSAATQFTAPPIREQTTQQALPVQAPTQNNNFQKAPVNVPRNNNNMERSVCLSYAKDLVIGDKIELKNIKEIAEGLLEYVQYGIEGKKEDIPPKSTPPQPVAQAQPAPVETPKAKPIPMPAQPEEVVL